MTLKVGDWIVRNGFINFWPGQIIEVNPEGSYRKRIKILWNDKNDWEWHGDFGFTKISPLVLLAMQALDE